MPPGNHHCPSSHPLALPSLNCVFHSHAVASYSFRQLSLQCHICIPGRMLKKKDGGGRGCPCIREARLLPRMTSAFQLGLMNQNWATALCKESWGTCVLVGHLVALNKTDRAILCFTKYGLVPTFPVSLQFICGPVARRGSVGTSGRDCSVFILHLYFPALTLAATYSRKACLRWWKTTRLAADCGVNKN